MLEEADVTVGSIKMNRVADGNSRVSSSASSDEVAIVMTLSMSLSIEIMLDSGTPSDMT